MTPTPLNALAHALIYENLRTAQAEAVIRAAFTETNALTRVWITREYDGYAQGEPIPAYRAPHPPLAGPGDPVITVGLGWLNRYPTQLPEGADLTTRREYAVRDAFEEMVVLLTTVFTLDLHLAEGHEPTEAHREAVAARLLAGQRAQRPESRWARTPYPREDVDALIALCARFSTPATETAQARLGLLGNLGLAAQNYEIELIVIIMLRALHTALSADTYGVEARAAMRAILVRFPEYRTFAAASLSPYTA